MSARILAAVAALIVASSVPHQDGTLRLASNGGVSEKAINDDLVHRVGLLSELSAKRLDVGINMLLGEMGFARSTLYRDVLPIAYGVGVRAESASVAQEPWEFVGAETTAKQRSRSVTVRGGTVELASGGTLRRPKGSFVLAVLPGARVLPDGDLTGASQEDIDAAAIVVSADQTLFVVNRADGVVATVPNRYTFTEDVHIETADYFGTLLTRAESPLVRAMELGEPAIGAAFDALVAYVEAYGVSPRGWGEVSAPSPAFPKGQEFDSKDTFGQELMFRVKKGSVIVWSIGANGTNDQWGGDDRWVSHVSARFIEDVFGD